MAIKFTDAILIIIFRQRSKCTNSGTLSYLCVIHHTHTPTHTKMETIGVSIAVSI